MVIVLLGNHFIECGIIRHVEINGVTIILRVNYGGRVWTVFCYRSIHYLSASCLYGDVLQKMRLEKDMRRCLTILKSKLRNEGEEALQKQIIKLCHIYFTRQQLSDVNTTWEMY
jgi:hypothetical protein